MVGIDKDDNMPVLGITGHDKRKEKRTRETRAETLIAVYYAYGEPLTADSSASTDEGINSEKVIKDLRKLKDDEECERLSYCV